MFGKSYGWMLAAALAASFCATGCARRYVMTMNNGMQTTSRGKPKLEQGMYKFKDMSGQVRSVSAGRVREIAPASMAREDKARFNPSTSK